MTQQRGKVLFLCTGNYYRSRFAEMLFNARAAEARIGWAADSRALAADLTAIRNVGAISTYVLEGLAQRGIDVNDEMRFPMKVGEEDLASADRIIAMKEAEHRPLIEERFPAWADHVEYWHVHDLDGWAPPEALSRIEGEVAELLKALSSNGGLGENSSGRGSSPGERR